MISKDQALFSCKVFCIFLQKGFHAYNKTLLIADFGNDCLLRLLRERQDGKVFGKGMTFLKILIFSCVCIVRTN